MNPTPAFPRLASRLFPARMLVHAALFGLLSPTISHGKENRVEVPLVLEAEVRQLSLAPEPRRPADSTRYTDYTQKHLYELIVVFGCVEKLQAWHADHAYVLVDYEPAGLSLDSDPDNVSPEPAGDSWRRSSLPKGASGSVNERDQKSFSVGTRFGKDIQFEVKTKELNGAHQSSSTRYSDWLLDARIKHDGDQTTASGTDNRVPLHWLAGSLAFTTRKNVLMSARTEKRWCPEFSADGSIQKKTGKLVGLLEAENIEVRLIDPDTYVLLEAPGKEQPFPYSAGRPRATQLEQEREAWFVKNSDYVPQGLIYQPTLGVPVAYPKRDTRVRHAAAALAKLSGKEVFVSPRAEKREFDVSRDAGTLATPELEIDLLTRQLDKADVRIVALNPQSLALVAE